MPMTRCRPNAGPTPPVRVNYRAAAPSEGLPYKGVWSDDREYQAGEFVTCKGGLWHCDADTWAKPGTPDSGWRLAVKAGKAKP